MQSTPTKTDLFRVEHLHDDFAKIYQPGIWNPFHVLSAPDFGWPHDHPFSLDLDIVIGGYEEEVYSLQPDGTWSMEVFERRAGTSHRVEAGTIHRIVEHYKGFTVSYAKPGPYEQDWHHFRADEHGIWRAPGNNLNEWQLLIPRNS